MKQLKKHIEYFLFQEDRKEQFYNNGESYWGFSDKANELWIYTDEELSIIWDILLLVEDNFNNK